MHRLCRVNSRRNRPIVYSALTSLVRPYHNKLVVDGLSATGELCSDEICPRVSRIFVGKFPHHR
jgi:hypothetical protein